MCENNVYHNYPATTYIYAQIFISFGKLVMFVQKSISIAYNCAQYFVLTFR